MARINFLPYEEAKERIQSLNLRSFREYCKLSKQGKLPERIPSAPHDVYKGKGWIDWSDLEKKDIVNHYHSKRQKRLLKTSILGLKKNITSYTNKGNYLRDYMPIHPIHTETRDGFLGITI